MKKAIAIILILFTLLTLFGCNQPADSGDTTTPSKSDITAGSEGEKGDQSLIPPTGTFKLTIEDDRNLIIDKAEDRDSYYAPGTVIKLHSYPICDADLEMWVDGEFFCKQTDVTVNGQFMWEFTFVMPIDPATLTFKVGGGI